MAVQAQYPSNLFLFNRNDKERKNSMEYTTMQTETTPLQSTNFFSTGGKSIDTRKRERDSNPTPQQECSPINIFSSQSQQQQQQQQNPQISSSVPSPITMSQLQLQWQEHHHQQLQQQRQQRRQPNSLVSTNLHLSFPDHQQERQNQLQQQHNIDLSILINLQHDEINHFLHAQEEKLRRTLVGTQRKHYRALISAAEQSFSRILKNKELELETSGRRNAELEEKVGRLREESATLQAKVRADEVAAAALRTQLRQAAEAAVVMVEDSGSACVDPRREVEGGRLGVCRRCWSAKAEVVVLPCRHLCLCRGCDVEVCPVCGCVRSATVEVYLS